MVRSSGFFPQTSPRTFPDRRAAGCVVAEELAAYRGSSGVVVLGLARGGVPVGWEVASALQAPLDVFLVRKLGMPQWPELAMGALATGDQVVTNDDVIARLGVTDDELQAVIDRETIELHRRERAYRGDQPATDLRAKTVIVVDDGVATGASMLASIRAIRAAGPATVITAAPVGAAQACQQLAEEADDVVCATVPASFRAVGQAFADFRQVTDGEVRALLTTPTVPTDGSPAEPR